MTPHTLITMITDIAQHPAGRTRKLTMMMPNKNVCLLSHNIHINATDVPRLLKAKKCGIYLWVGHEREHGSTGKRERTHGKVGRAINRASSTEPSNGHGSNRAELYFTGFFLSPLAASAAEPAAKEEALCWSLLFNSPLAAGSS
jgi:hypothetical protein